MTSRNYCFTLNNPTPRELELLSTMGNQIPADRLKFLVFQTEKGNTVPTETPNLAEEHTHGPDQSTTGGTVHIQGYLELSGSQRISWVKRKFPALRRAHLENRRGNQQQAVDYCMKDDTRVAEGFSGYFGTPAVQGRRVDLEAIRALLESDAPMIEIAQANFGNYLRYNRGFEKYRLLFRNRRGGPSRILPMPVIEIHWGVSRSGKSHYLFETAPDAYYPIKPSGTVWMDGISSEHKEIAVQDFYSWWPFDFLLRLCDKWPMLLQVKNGMINKPPIERIIFTSNQDPRTWYSNFAKMGGADNAFFKRVREGGRIVYYNSDGATDREYPAENPVAEGFFQ